MNWGIYIGVMIAFSAALGVAWVAWATFVHKRNLARYDNYDRELSTKDLAFLEQAQADLEAAAEVEMPFWYKIVLYTGFLPAMFLCGGLILGVYWGFQQLFQNSDVPPDDLILSTGGDSQGALIAGIMGSIFLAGALLYAMSLRSQRFSNFVALNSNAYGFNKESIMQGLLEKLNHKVRSRQQSTLSKFSADEFLNQVNRSYRDLCLKAFYGFLIVVAVLLAFDLRAGVDFQDRKMVGTDVYFSISPKQTIPYSRISKVELDCYYYDDEPRASYAIFVDGEEFVSLFLRQDRLTSLGKLNTILRKQSQIKFEPRLSADGTNWLSPKCVDRLGEEFESPELLRAILSTAS